MDTVAAAIADAFENHLLLLAIILFVVGAGGSLLFADTRRPVRRRPPGPWGLPIVGYLPFLNREAAHVSLTNLARRYGAIYRLRLGRIPTVVISDPSLLRLAFGNDAFNGRPSMSLAVSVMENYGIFAAEGDRWKEQRRFVSKTLRSFGITKSLMSPSAVQMQKRMVDEISSLHQKMRQTDGRPSHYRTIVRRTMANLATTLLFSKTFDDGDPSLERQLELLDLGAEIADVAGAIDILPFLRFLPKFSGVREKISAIVGGMEDFLAALADERRRNRGGDGTADDRDFTDVYLAEMNRRQKSDFNRPSYFDDKQFRHVLGDLFSGSVESTTTTIDWAFLYLVVNPTAQAKCQEEMDAVVGRNRDPTLEDRRLCPYTWATLLETQRLASVVPLGAPHSAVEDAFLGDYFIPKGTMIVPLFWAINTDPNLWPPDPWAFRPERFLDEGGALRVPEHFTPFSTGKRICVGEEFARMMLFLTVAITLHRFELQLPVDDEADRNPDLTPVSGMVIKPHPYRICAVPRSSRD